MTDGLRLECYSIVIVVLPVRQIDLPREFSEICNFEITGQEHIEKIVKDTEQ